MIREVSLRLRNYVCVCGGGGGGGACVCQLVGLVGTLMPDCVGSVANGLGCLKV